MKISGGLPHIRTLQQPAPSGGKQKYNAVPTTTELGKFDSKHEANWAARLTLLQEQGYIKNLRLLKCDLRFALDVAGTRICDYEADARFDAVKDFDLSGAPQHRMKAGRHYVCDAKSAPTRKTAGYVIKRKLMWAIHGVEIVEL